MQAYADQELLEALRQDNQQAFEVLYTRYKQKLYLQALGILQDRELAKDLIHEIFLKLWERRQELEVETQLGAYLYQAMRYKSIDYLKKKQNLTAYHQHFQWFTQVQGDQADYQVREKIMQQLIEQEIQHMPPRMQQVFRLSRHEHKSHAEIADLLNLSEQSVRSHIKNALRILRSKLTIPLLVILVLLGL